MRILFTFLPSLLVACVWSFNSFGDDQQLQQIRSRLEALKLNNMSVRNFDVVYWTDMQADKEDAGYENFRQVTRLCMDLDRKICAKFSFGKREDLELQENPEFREANRPKHSRLLSAMVIKDGYQTWRDWPGRRYTVANTEGFFAALSRQRVATFHFSGVSPFPISGVFINSPDQGNHPLAFADELWATFSRQWSRGTLKWVAGHEELVIDATQNPLVDYSVDHRLKFDPDLQVPTSHSKFVTLKGERYRQSNEFIEWIDREGIYLPVEIYTDRLANTTWGEQKKRIEYVASTAYRIHWLSVNAEPPQQLFDTRILDDPESVMKLVDPEELGLGESSPWHLD